MIDVIWRNVELNFLLMRSVQELPGIRNTYCSVMDYQCHQDSINLCARIKKLFNCKCQLIVLQLELTFTLLRFFYHPCCYKSCHSYMGKNDILVV